MTIPLISPNTTPQFWLYTTNQTIAVLNQLTDGTLYVNGALIFSNSQFSLTLSSINLTSSFVATTPSGNSFTLASSNAVVNGTIFLTGSGTQNNSLYVSNNATFYSNVTVNRTLNTGNLTIANPVQNLPANNLIANTITANNITANNISLNSGNVTHGASGSGVGTKITNLNDFPTGYNNFLEGQGFNQFPTGYNWQFGSKLITITPPSTSFTALFPTPFATACLMVFPNLFSLSPNTQVTLTAQPIAGNTTFFQGTAIASNATSAIITFLAIGN